MTNYLITGATGMLGSMLIKSIMSSKEYTAGETKIIALARDEAKFKEIFKDCDCRYVFLKIMDLCSAEDVRGICEPVDYIIHCAAATASAYMISNPVEVADGIVLGTKNILELAGQKQVESMVFLSSMEVYGNVSDIGRPRREEELGDISLASTRSCYPLAKRMAEHYCYIYSKEYDVPVKTARLAQTFGKGVRPEDNRVYMQFARAAHDGRDIVLKTAGNSMGNYCATEDAVSAIFTILYKGAAGEVYNVVNELNTMSIRSMAELVAERIAEGKIEVRTEVEDSKKTGYAPDTGLRLSGEKLRGLGWRATKELTQMYEDVLSELEQKNVFAKNVKKF